MRPRPSRLRSPLLVALALIVGLGILSPVSRAAATTIQQAEDKAEEDTAPADAGGEEARARRAHYQAIRDELYALVEQENPRVALARMRTLMKEDPALLRSCHPFMHQIGRRAYARYGSFAEAAQYRDDLCNSGYLHGVIEGHFLAVPNPLESMKTLCDVYEPNKYAAWQCFHGIGHGVMFFKKNDLPAALALCGELAGAFARGTCANGAYMENFNAEEQLHPSRYRNPADPLFPCELEGLGYRADCYLYAPAYYLALQERDYEGALKLCAEAPTHARAVCTQGVGSQAIKENVDDPLFVEQLCDAGQAWQRHPCISGMIGLFANHHGTLGPVEELCDQLRADNRALCVSEVQARRSFF